MILYTLAHGLIVLNSGIFWDDWTLYNVEKSLIISHFTDAGFPWTGYLHVFLLSLNNGILFYRLTVLLSFLLSALLLNSILKNISEID